MKTYVRVTASILGVLFLGAALWAAVDLWIEGNLLANPKLKPAGAWLTTGAMFLAVGLKGLRRRRSGEDQKSPRD